MSEFKKIIEIIKNHESLTDNEFIDALLKEDLYAVDKDDWSVGMYLIQNANKIKTSKIIGVLEGCDMNYRYNNEINLFIYSLWHANKIPIELMSYILKKTDLNIKELGDIKHVISNSNLIPKYYLDMIIEKVGGKELLPGGETFQEILNGYVEKKSKNKQSIK